MLRTVTILESGRSGEVRYQDPRGALRGYWEFGGGDVVVIIAMGAPAGWPPALADDRDAVLAFVAAEAIRQRSPTSHPDIDPASGDILLREPAGDAVYANGAFLRPAQDTEPVRLAGPDGGLILYEEAPDRRGTLHVARVDTGIDRFQLQQILPGDGVTAFVGPRPAIPDKVPEPLLVIVQTATGEVAVHSLWQ